MNAENNKQKLRVMQFQLKFNSNKLFFLLVISTVCINEYIWVIIINSLLCLKTLRFNHLAELFFRKKYSYQDVEITHKLLASKHPPV